MCRLIFNRLRRSVILTALLGLTVWAGSLQAASFRTVWDPEFNEAFSALAFPSDPANGVGWRGEAFITVSESCVDPGQIVIIADCGTGTLDSFSLEFYELLDPDLTTKASGSSGPGFPGETLSRVSFDGIGIANGIEVPAPNLFIDAGLISFSAFDLGTYRALLRFDLATNNPDRAAGPFLRLIENCDDVELCDTFNSEVDDFPPQSDWFRVPEPAPLSLLVAGLVAIGLSRRSRKA